VARGAQGVLLLVCPLLAGWHRPRRCWADHAMALVQGVIEVLNHGAVVILGGSTHPQPDTHGQGWGSFACICLRHPTAALQGGLQAALSQPLGPDCCGWSCRTTSGGWERLQLPQQP
jgi:hypothetical protein